MKILFTTLLSCILLVGCSNSAHYAVLEHADSLMNKNLDSAYTLIKSLNSKDLSRKNNAYYSLLLTTAQYKKVMPIENDSVINIAVNYYTDHFDQEKLTKALMYKGGVLADLKYNKLALASYKEAEKLADTTDYLTMGLLNTRLGKLYQSSYIKNDEDIKRYKQALHYYKKVNHKTFENYTMIPLGQLYILRDLDSAEYYLKQAIFLAEERKDKLSHINGLATLARLYKHYNIKTKEIIDILSTVYQESDSKPIRQSVISDIAILYSKVGKLDSAEYYAKQFSTPTKATDFMRYHMMREEIALARNDYKTAYSSQKRANKIADSIVKQGKSEEYYAIDKEFDNTILKTKYAQLETSNYIKILIIYIATLLLIIIVMLWYIYSKRKKNLLNQNRLFIHQLQTEYELQQINIQKLSCNIKLKNENETSILFLLKNHIDLMKQIMDLKYHFGSNANDFIKKFNTFLNNNKQSAESCKAIIDTANYMNPKVIDYLTFKYPSLTEKDLLLLSLICLRFSVAMVCVYMNYTDKNVTFVSRNRLSKKLNTNLTLEDFIDENILEAQKQYKN